MVDWLRHLPGAVAYDVIAALLLIFAGRAYQRLKRLEGSYGKDYLVTISDSVDVSDAITHALRGTVQGGGSMSGELSVGPPKKRYASVAEELLLWYLRVRLS